MLLVATIGIVSHRPTWLLALDAFSWATQTTVAVMPERQKVTAIHEAGHAVASVALQGASSVHSLRVYTEIPTGSRDTLLGQSDTDMFIQTGSRTDALKIAAILHAGSFAETEYTSKESDSSESDRRQATRAIMSAATARSGSGLSAAAVKL